MFESTDLDQVLDHLGRFHHNLCQADLLTHAAVVQAVTGLILGYFQLNRLQTNDDPSKLTHKGRKKKPKQAATKSST